MKLQILIILLFLTAGAGPVQHEAEEKLEVRLKEMAREQLSSRYPDASFGVELRWLPSRLGEVQARDIQRIQMNSRDLPRALVSAEVLAGGKTYPVQFFITTRIQVPVARLPVARDHVIRESMMEMKQMDVTNFGQLPVRRIPYGEFTARQDIPAGEPIYQSDLSGIPVVEHGNAVVMQYRMHGLTVELNCETRRAGGTGELITVRCTETGKRYEVEVLNENTVMWRKTL
ncbi:MAG: flagellar basal body P-ring formation chaperone FlgA [Balneolaceae bacterium]